MIDRLITLVESTTEIGKAEAGLAARLNQAEQLYERALARRRKGRQT